MLRLPRHVSGPGWGLSKGCCTAGPSTESDSLRASCLPALPASDGDASSLVLDRTAVPSRVGAGASRGQPGVWVRAAVRRWPMLPTMPRRRDALGRGPRRDALGPAQPRSTPPRPAWPRLAARGHAWSRLAEPGITSTATKTTIAAAAAAAEARGREPTPT